MKSIFLALMLAVATSLFSQQTALTDTAYLKKSKSQKTAAWVLAGGGTALVITGLVAYGNKVDDTNNPFEIFDTSELFLTVLGGAVLLTSKILFMTAAKNKKRAAALSLKKERIQTINKSGFSYLHLPVVSLTIPL